VKAATSEPLMMIVSRSADEIGRARVMVYEVPEPETVTGP
jgi:hypothetical protein